MYCAVNNKYCKRYGPEHCALYFLVISVYSTDCSIDFDWLQVDINKEQIYRITEKRESLQYEVQGT